MVPSCPDAASLQRLLDGTLPETVQAELSQHLETCTPCRAALDKVATDGRSLIGLACDLHQNPTPPEPGLQRLLQDAARAAPGETQAEPRANKNEDLAFLAPSSRPGTLGRLDHYQIQEVIGRGAFGIVLKAFDEKLHRVVAIKVLAPQVASSGTARKRFTREAQAAAAVAHEHVVPIHAVEDDHNPPYLVMQCIDGMSLQEKLDQGGPLGLKEILRIGLQTAEGLAAAHKQGLVHRDIKPANILLENGVERVRITDFGLARAMDDARLTQSGVVAGTPQYMAPEQARGELVDHRADLFSLGSVLYALCTGRTPFRASGTMAVLKRVCEDTPRPIREINPDIPAWLCDVIRKLHAKDPAERFPLAQDVADVLATYLAELQVHGGTIPSDAGRAAGAGSVGNPHKQDAPGSMRSWAIAAGVLALLSLTIGAILYPSRNTGTAPDHQNKDPNGQPIGDAGNASPPAVAPFDADKAKAHQDAWAKHLGVNVEVTNSIGMKLRLIPPGEFVMGTPAETLQQFVAKAKADGVSDIENSRIAHEGVPHPVRVTRPYYLGSYEVTYAQFSKFVEAVSYRTELEKNGLGGWSNYQGKWVRRPEHVWKTPGDWPTSGDEPAVQLAWNDANAFCEWLSRTEGVRYTLPTEAQWEFACRAGTAGVYYPDDCISLGEYAWTSELLADKDTHRPRPVGLKKPNAFGLFDMLGNAWEYCSDWYGDGPTTAALQIDPTGPQQGVARVIRGGAWYRSGRLFARCSGRSAGECADAGVGFRVAIVGDLKARTPKPQ